MSEFQQQYKKKAVGFGNTEDSRILRAIRVQNARRVTRAQKFATNRDISNVDEENRASEKDSRLLQLLKWQKEREQLKKLKEAKKKPVFKVGIVHHKLYSPMHEEKGVSKTVQHSETIQPSTSAPPQRITRATEKRLARKLANQSNEIQSKAKLTQKKKKVMSFAPANYTFKAPAGLTNLPIFGQAALDMQKVEPVKISPWRVQIHEIPSDTLSEKPTTSSQILFGQTALDNTRSLAEFPEIPNKTLPTVNLGTELSSIKVPYKMDSDLTSAISSSSIESVTLRLSPEQLETLDCPERRTSPCKKNSPITNIRNNVEHAHTMSPAFFSPYVVSSRGKNNARKEQKIRRGIGNSPSEIPTKDTVMQNLNISIEEEERTAQYFKFISERETTRLTELCNNWSDIQSIVSEDARYQIVQAIGQTNLLINKKFQRFLNLIQDCETGKGEMLVTCKDLQGFWDMMYREVKDCDSRFSKLEELKAKGWVEDEPEPEPVQKVVKKKGPIVIKRKNTNAMPKQSSIREMIAAARKRKIATRREENQDGNDIIIVDKKRVDPTFPKQSPLKTNGIIEINVLKPTIEKTVEHNILTPSKDLKCMSLLQKVQLSTERKYKSPLTVMKVSQMCKTPDVQLDNSIAYVNSDQTPGRSILKRSDALKELARDKSIYKVNFNDTVACTEIPVDEEEQNKIDLTARLAMIEDLDFDDIHEPPAVSCNKDYEIHAEKKLDFADDTFEEMDQPTTNENIEGQELKIDNDIEDAAVLNNTKIVEVTKKINVKNKKKLRRQDNIDLPDDCINKEPEVLRTLRNRTIRTGDTPTRKSTQRKQVIPSEDTESENNVKNSEQKENNSPTKSRQRNSMKHTQTEKSDSQDDAIEETTDRRTRSSILIKTDENLGIAEKRRRSTRKSIRFTGEECVICTDSKPVLPKTPHVRRQTPRKSTRVSLLPMRLEESISNTEDKDLISWDSPVTRSSVKHNK